MNRILFGLGRLRNFHTRICTYLVIAIAAAVIFWLQMRPLSLIQIIVIDFKA
jgi:hypothetical protein